MHKNRLEAFSDGVIAILITIMVLELKVPHEHGLAALVPLIPVILSYVLSFIYLGIYWNNHHHLFQAAQHVTGRVLWANLHLLFWLSLVPFATGWLAEEGGHDIAAALYGVVLLMAGVAYHILSISLIRGHGDKSPLAKAIGTDFKGKVSVVIYAIAIALSFVQAPVAIALYVLVAALWFIPDRRIEAMLK